MRYAKVRAAVRAALGMLVEACFEPGFVFVLLCLTGTFEGHKWTHTNACREPFLPPAASD